MSFSDTGASHDPLMSNLEESGGDAPTQPKSFDMARPRFPPSKRPTEGELLPRAAKKARPRNVLPQNIQALKDQKAAQRDENQRLKDKLEKSRADVVQAEGGLVSVWADQRRTSSQQ
ncbi:hypothetical protein Dimus_003284 [Dionaea muscipula]